MSLICYCTSVVSRFRLVQRWQIRKRLFAQLYAVLYAERGDCGEISFCDQCKNLEDLFQMTAPLYAKTFFILISLFVLLQNCIAVGKPFL